MEADAAAIRTDRPNREPIIKYPITAVRGAHYGVKRIWNALTYVGVHRVLLDCGYELREILHGVGSSTDPYVDIRTTKGKLRVMYGLENRNNQRELWFYELE
jgi:hypothetical protein